MGLYGPVIPGCLMYATAVLAERQTNQARVGRKGCWDNIHRIIATLSTSAGGEYCHNVKGNVKPDFQRERSLPALM